MDISRELMTTLKQVSSNSDLATTLSGLYRRSFINNNEFAGSDNNFVIEHVGLTANSFEREGEADAGNSVAIAGIYVGNFAPDDIRLFSACRASQKSANVFLNVVEL